MQEPKLEQTQKPLRTCKTCGLQAFSESDLEKFSKDRNSKYGRLNYCIPCYLIIERAWKKRSYPRLKPKYQEYNKCNRAKQRITEQKMRDNRNGKAPEWQIKYSRKYRKKNPIKVKCQRMAYNLPLKDKCELCGKSDIKLVHHHPDYSKPLEYQTLCCLCHSKVHQKEAL